MKISNVKFYKDFFGKNDKGVFNKTKLDKLWSKFNEGEFSEGESELKTWIEKTIKFP